MNRSNEFTWKKTVFENAIKKLCEDFEKDTGYTVNKVNVESDKGIHTVRVGLGVRVKPS